jgi:hypothetical protein
MVVKDHKTFGSNQTQNQNQNQMPFLEQHERNHLAESPHPQLSNHPDSAQQGGELPPLFHGLFLM